MKINNDEEHKAALAEISFQSRCLGHLKRPAFGSWPKPSKSTKTGSGKPFRDLTCRPGKPIIKRLIIA